MNPYRNEPYGALARTPRQLLRPRQTSSTPSSTCSRRSPATATTSSGRWNSARAASTAPVPGVIYPTLQALEDQDFVKSAEEDGKKVYSITEAGLAYLQGHSETRDTAAAARAIADMGARPRPTERGFRRREPGRTTSPRRRSSRRLWAELGPHRSRRPGRERRRRLGTGRRSVLGILVRFERRPGDRCATCAGCSGTSPTRCSAPSATRRSSKRSARSCGKRRPRSTRS